MITARGIARAGGSVGRVGVPQQRSRCQRPSPRSSTT
jgi:hypothetical protein